MKKFLYLFLFLFVIVSCNKDETTTAAAKKLNPVQKQWGFVLEYTAKWCGPCGNWGAPTMHTLCGLSPYIVGIANHASGDPMYDASLYSSFLNDRTDGGGIPAFWIGDVSNYQNGTMTSLLAQPCTAAIDLSFTKTSTSMTVKTQTKFFTATNGNYFLSVLVLESGIDGGATASSDYKQNGTSDPNYKHEHVLRASSIAGNSYGESIINGAVPAGKTIDKTYTIPLNASWNKTVYPCAILWKYDAAAGKPQYKYVNCIKK
jgi:hypothetical protein